MLDSDSTCSTINLLDVHAQNQLFSVSRNFLALVHLGIFWFQYIQAFSGFCTSRHFLLWGIQAFSSFSASAHFLASAASTSGNVITNDIPCEKLEEWPPYLHHKLKHSNREKDWWIPDKTFKISNSTCSLMTREQHLLLQKANYVHSNA